MTLTLQLPSQLSEQIEQQAEKIGVSAEEHATELLAAAAAILGEDQMPAFGSPSEKVLAAEALHRMIRALFNEDERSEPASERASRIVGRVRKWAADEPVRNESANARPSALGKYAHIPGTSDDFARLKQEEIDQEDGRAA
jgi:hypothetical protein